MIDDLLTRETRKERGPKPRNRFSFSEDGTVRSFGFAALAAFLAFGYEPVAVSSQGFTGRPESGMIQIGMRAFAPRPELSLRIRNPKEQHRPRK
jgi:hypothetical protein